MQCKDFEKKWTDKGPEGLSPASRRHQQTCEACRELIEQAELLSKELDSGSPVRMPVQLKMEILNKAANPYPRFQFTLNILAILAFIPLVLFNIYPITGLLSSVYIKLTTILLTSPLLSIAGMILFTGTILTIPLIKNRF